MTKIYYKSRKMFFNQDWGWYTLEYLFKLQRPDFKDLVEINSFNIPLEKYKGYDFLVEVIVNDDTRVKEIKDIMTNFYKVFFSLEEIVYSKVKEYVTTSTDLIETENWFEVWVEEVDNKIKDWPTKKKYFKI